MFSKNLNDVDEILRAIDKLHTETFQTEGHLNSPGFYAERKRLLTQLDSQLTKLTKKSLGFPDHPNLKNVLGISTKSLVHRWRKAGAAGQIPGYATHIDAVSKAAKYVKHGGWISTAVGGGASALKVQGVCTEGNAEACEKVKFTEVGAFVGGVVGGVTVGSLLTAPLVGSLCAALSMPTGGTAGLVCGLLIVGTGSYVGGSIGGMSGENSAEVIYENLK